MCAFKKSFDYKNPAPRKNINSFILFYFLFWLLIFAPFIVYIQTTIILYKEPVVGFIVYFAVSWLYFIINAIPLLALVKRRLIDIVPSKANLIFWSYLAVEIVRISIVIAFITFFLLFMNTIKINLHHMVIFFAIGVINQILSFLVLAFYIFLMAKKGNL